MIETHEYLGISLIRVIKELAGRVRLLEEVVKAEPQLRRAYQERLGYRAAYEEDEYRQLVPVLQELLDQLEEIEDTESE